MTLEEVREVKQKALKILEDADAERAAIDLVDNRFAARISFFLEGEDFLYLGIDLYALSDEQFYELYGVTKDEILLKVAQLRNSEDSKKRVELADYFIDMLDNANANA